MSDDGAVALPEWVEGAGPDADVAISTRARLARTIASFPFPARASREELTEVARVVREAGVGLARRFPDLSCIDVAKLDARRRSYLFDAHVASAEHLNGGEGRIVILDPRAVLCVMVNEEDHVRLQVIKSGLVTEDAWELVDWADDVLAERLDYGFSERYGYLTADVSNVGTGLRISVMMHLAGLAMIGAANRQLRAAYDLGVSVRGLFGEGSRFVGDLYQVSNEVTLGLSETEIVRKVRTVAQYLLGEERLARKELLGGGRKSLVDSASKALQTLQGRLSVPVEEALRLMSPIRLASSLGLVGSCPPSLMNSLLAGMRADKAGDSRACMERAALLRHGLAEANVRPA